MREGEQTWLPHAWPDMVVGLEVLLASRQTLVVRGMENKMRSWCKRLLLFRGSHLTGGYGRGLE